MTKPARRKLMAAVSDEHFVEIVASSKSYADVARSIGLRIQGSNYHTIKCRIERQKLSTAHFQPFWKAAVNKTARPLSEILVKAHHSSSSSNLKKRLIAEGILKEECIECGNRGEWNGRPLTLQLDHIDGDHNNNQLENLRILCPNCHTQTKTHSGKRLKRIYHCSKCEKEYAGYGKVCRSCNETGRPTLINWPTDDALKKMLWTRPAYQVAQELKCSSGGLRRHCQKRRIEVPPMGYWQKIDHGYSPKEALLPTPEPSYTHMSQADIEKACRLREEGMNDREIARQLGYSHTTIGRRLKLVPQPGIEPR